VRDGNRKAVLCVSRMYSTILEIVLAGKVWTREDKFWSCFLEWLRRIPKVGAGPVFRYSRFEVGRVAAG